MRASRVMWLGGAAIVVAGIAWYTLRPATYDVELAAAARRHLEVTVDEKGITDLRQHVDVAAPVTGRLLESRLRPGDSVDAGAVVARLRPAPLDDRERRQGEAAIEAAKALHEEADARVAQAQASFDDAVRERERVTRLVEVGGRPARDLEQAALQEQLRRREVDAATARERAAAEDERRARSALLGAAAGNHGPVHEIRAPIGGRVIRIYQEHDRVVPAGTILLEIGDPRSVEFHAEVLTRDATSIEPGMPIRVRLDAERTVTAHVARIEPGAFTKLSPLGVEEQRVNVIGRFDSLPAGLGDDYEIDVSIIRWSGEVVAIPNTALVPLDTGWGVFVAEGSRARLRRIATGHRSDRDVEICGGLSAGERIVTLPDDRLRDRDRIRPRPD